MARLLAKVERDRQAKVYALAQYTSGHTPKDGARNSGGVSRAGDMNGLAKDKLNVAIDRRPSGGSSSSVSSSSVSSGGVSWREYEWYVGIFVCFHMVSIAFPVHTSTQLTISRTLCVPDLIPLSTTPQHSTLISNRPFIYISLVVLQMRRVYTVRRFYTDPTMKQNGPFTPKQMRKWFQAGYLKRALPVVWRLKDDAGETGDARRGETYVASRSEYTLLGDLLEQHGKDLWVTGVSVATSHEASAVAAASRTSSSVPSDRTVTVATGMQLSSMPDEEDDTSTRPQVGRECMSDDAAARVIQRTFRLYVQEEIQRLMHLLASAAVMIQRSYRRFRRRMQARRRWRRRLAILVAAAVRIQTLWRGWLAREQCGRLFRDEGEVRRRRASEAKLRRKASALEKRVAAQQEAHAVDALEVQRLRAENRRLVGERDVAQRKAESERLDKQQLLHGTEQHNSFMKGIIGSGGLQLDPIDWRRNSMDSVASVSSAVSSQSSSTRAESAAAVASNAAVASVVADEKDSPRRRERASQSMGEETKSRFRGRAAAT